MLESKERLRQMLVSARNLLQSGWCQHVLHQAGDKHCALGALRVSADNPYHELYGCWHLEQTAGITNIVDWNDAPGRTQQEVVELFDRAIAGL